MSAFWKRVATLAALVLVGSACTGDPAPSGDGATAETPAAADGGPVTGVTDDTINVSFIGADFGGLAEAGLAPELGDQEATIRAVVDEINDSGGVAGRQIDLNVHIVDGVGSPEAGRAACLRATEEDEAFLVLIANAVSRDTTRCVAVQHRTLVIGGTGWDAQLYEEAEGRLFSLGSHITMSTDRQFRAWASVLDEAGELDGKTIGVVVSDTPELVPAVEGGLIPELERLGHDVAAHVVLPCPEGVAACEQHEAAVQRLKGDGVDLVFMSANILSGVQLVTAAVDLDFHPQWTANRDQLTDTVAQFFASVAEEWDGTVGVSTLWPPAEFSSDEAEDCNRVVAERAGERYEPASDAFGFTAVNCIHVRTFAEALEGLDRIDQASAIEAIESLGEVPVHAGPATSIGPDKHDAGDAVFIARYDAAEGRFVPEDLTPRIIPD